MSKTPLIRPRPADAASLSFAIVASRYNNSFVQPMVDFAIKEIGELEPGAQVSTFRVPGSFEIPLAVKLVGGQRKFDAILALGVVLQGETAHASLVGKSVTTALMNLALELRVPVIHEVLLLESAEQAAARCLGTKFNRGTEAARAAVTMARTVRKLSRQTS